MWKKHFLIALIFTFFQMANFKSTLAKILLEEDQTLRANSSNSLLFDSYEDDIININKIDAQLIQNAFRIESFHPGNLIQLVFLDSMNFNREIVYFVCQLIQNENSYFIKCIDGLLPSKTNQTTKIHSNAQNYSIQLTSNINEKCYELSVGNYNQIFVNCISLNNLKIYHINIKSQTSFIYQVTSEVDCLNKIININQQQFLVIYNCEDWRIILFQKTNLLTILNSELLKTLVSESLIEIYILSEAFVCQTFLFLVEQQNYYVFEFINENFTYLKNHRGEMKIQHIQFTINCDIEYIVVQNFNNNTNALTFDPQKKEIALNQQLNFEVYATSTLLFLKNNSQVNLILCDFLNQTYTFGQQKLHFLNTVLKMNSYKIQSPKVFYQIDQNTQSAQFYEYLQCPLIFKPTKKYFYEVKNLNLFTTKQQQNINSQEIVYFNPNIIQYYEIFAENNCQFTLETLFLKNQKGLPNMYVMQLNQESQIIESINDEEEFYKKFKELKNINIEQIIFYDYIESNNGFLTFIRNEYLEIYSFSDKQIIYQLKEQHLQQKLALSYFINAHQEFIVIVNLDLNQLIVLQSQKKIVIKNQKHFNKQILTIQHNMKYLIIQFIDQSFCIIYLLDLSQFYLEDQIYQLGVPLYFYQRATYILLQYEKFLIVKINHEWRIIRFFENFSIFYVYYITNQWVLKTIHNVYDQIVLFFIDQNGVISKEQYDIQQSKLIRPLIVRFNNNFMAIASITDSQKNILVFQVSHYIKLINIKFCNNFSFVLSGGLLIYFNQVNQLKILDLNYYKIFFINTPLQTNHRNKFIVNVSIVYQKSKEIVFASKIINITILNNCYKLFRKNTTFQQDSTNKLILSNFYHGPIINITIKNDNQIQLTGPLQIHYTLEFCNKDNVNLCKIEYRISYLSTQQYFDFLCIQQFQNCWLDPYPQNTLTLIKKELLHNQTIQLNIIKIDEQYFLHLFQVDHQKRLITEISYQLITELTKEFKIQEINQKNFLILKNQQQFPSIPYYLLYFSDERNYSKYILQNELLFICPIQNYNNLYVFLEWTQNKLFRNTIEFKIVQLINNEKNFLYSFILQDKFFKLVEQHTQVIPSLISTIKQISFCNLDHQKLEFNILFIFVKFSCEIKFFYNSYTGDQQYKIQKIFRNPLSDEVMFLDYYDSQYIILTARSLNKYLYDLTQNQSMYDHISQMKYDIQLTKVNNNLFLFTSKTGQQIGEIGYKIQDLRQENQLGKNIYVYASNDVSKDEQIQLILDEERINNENLKVLSYVLLIIIFSLFCIYFIRRKKIKKFQLDSKQHNIYNKSSNIKCDKNTEVD